MCGIIGAAAERNVAAILVECLRRLEYRGYDSAGIAIFNQKKGLERIRVAGKIDKLAQKIKSHPVSGNIGIAHTRWATHGAPTENNAHPHISHNSIAIVHNGIIENFEELREKLKTAGYKFQTETDTEVIVHLIHKYTKAGNDFIHAVHKAVQELSGAFALNILNCAEPNKIIAVRYGSPIVIGVGIEENFIASDAIALLPVTNQFIYLEEGDIAVVSKKKVDIFNDDLESVTRQIKISTSSQDAADQGGYRHFMQKEIFEQPKVIADTLDERIGKDQVYVETFGSNAKKIFGKIKRIQIVACGTSYHAGLVAQNWLEHYAKLPCRVEIASEFRYRNIVVEPDCLFVTISQSGETADTLAALRMAKKLKFAATLAICNAPESSLVRESDLVFMVRAGIEVGVASTKAFTAQLTALLMLTLALAQTRFKNKALTNLVKQLKHIPKAIEAALLLDEKILELAERFTSKQHAYFLGRGISCALAMEGALKMKEISYIHAESFPAGELKHGPLALIDKNSLIIVIAPNDELLEKLKSNLHEVRARGGELIIIADENSDFEQKPGWTILPMPTHALEIAPIVYAIPLQLLAYHVAVLMGTDVDRPRNLAKSVTVE
ncbi:MAG: glutamine--fructose-6-phosphate transaminase (isomerizing) [Gammaproteobacteria bacterium]|nr:glutamine--fructose-6-phosphate transaminase (isomerizing) [Gammaproteobacteria bacterium]